MRTVARAQLQEKVVGLVSLEKLKTLDPFIQRKHRPGIVKFSQGKGFVGHTDFHLRFLEIITTDEGQSKPMDN
jgi:hypothetical protein